MGWAVFYAALAGLALKGPDTENAVLFTAVVPVAAAALRGGWRRAAAHAALATGLVWLAGALRPYRVWVGVGAIQTALFWVIAVVVGLTQERCAADLRRRAAQAGEAGERVKALQEKVDQLNAELNKSIFDILAIYEFTTVLGGTLQLKEILNMMVDTIMRVVRYDACFLALNEGGGRLELKVARGFTPEQLERFSAPRLAEGVLGRVAHSAQPLIVPDLAGQAWSELYPALPYRSLLSLPLVIQGEAVGVLNLFKREPNAFTQDDLRVLFIVTNQCAFAVQNGKLYGEMAKLAITDGLTGLYNHRYFYSCIEEAVDRADRTGRSASMIMVDADRFKEVNDRFGHQRGDQVLQQIARLIQESVRESDLVARYGGEEFAVILPDAGPQEAAAVAQRICQAVADYDFDGLRLTVSVGVATYPSSRIRSRDDLISMADEYAYRAKEQGRNQICGEGGL